jgi:hypothetical protein
MTADESGGAGDQMFIHAQRVSGGTEDSMFSHPPQFTSFNPSADDGKRFDPARQ